MIFTSNTNRHAQVTYREEMIGAIIAVTLDDKGIYVRVSLRALRLIPRALKLTTI
jgi:hypothetical protein